MGSLYNEIYKLSTVRDVETFAKTQTCDITRSFFSWNKKQEIKTSLITVQAKQLRCHLRFFWKTALLEVTALVKLTLEQRLTVRHESIGDRVVPSASAK